MIVWRDGEFVEAAGAVAADDRGFLIGDAVFETILVDHGAPAFLDRHLERMRRGRDTLGIARNLDAEEVGAAIDALARRNSFPGRAVCRVTLSRSGGPRGLAPHGSAKPRLYLSLAAAAAPPERLRVIVSGRRRWTGASTNSFKCAGAYAENMLARTEASSRGADEAILLNEAGRVACATSANLFVVMDDRLLTPALSEGAMPGVVRGILLEEAETLGIEPSQSLVTPDDLLLGDLLLTNSVIGPARAALEGSPGSGGGAAAGRLIAAYQRRLDAEFSRRTGARA